MSKMFSQQLLTVGKGRFVGLEAFDKDVSDSAHSLSKYDCEVTSDELVVLRFNFDRLRTKLVNSDPDWWEVIEKQITHERENLQFLIS